MTMRSSEVDFKHAGLGRLIEVLSFSDCLARLGCGEREASRLIEDWLQGEEGSVVDRVFGPAGEAAPTMPVA